MILVWCCEVIDLSSSHMPFIASSYDQLTTLHLPEDGFFAQYCEKVKIFGPLLEF